MTGRLAVTHRDKMKATTVTAHVSPPTERSPAPPAHRIFVDCWAPVCDLAARGLFPQRFASG
jgi:hypothetical protein